MGESCLSSVPGMFRAGISGMIYITYNENWNQVARIFVMME
jgi:hypothetical protein